MSTVRVQTVIDKKLKEDVENLFESEGLSLNEGVRFLITQFKKGNITIGASQVNKVYTASKWTEKRVEDAINNLKNAKEVKNIDDLDDLL